MIKIKNILIVLTIMSTIVAIITSIMTYVNLSPSQSFFDTWLTSLMFALMVMLPMGGLIFATMTKLVNHFFDHLSVRRKKLIQGVLMATTMELIMATVTTATNHHDVMIFQAFNFFITSFIYALPIGITISCFMTFVLQPRLERFLAS